MSINNKDIIENDSDTAVSAKKFKIENMIGKLHVKSFENDGERLIFHWDYAEYWIDKPNDKKFLGGIRRGKRQESLKLKDLFFVCWNRGKGTAEFELDQSEATSGRIVFDDYFNRMNDSDVRSKRSRYFFILAGTDEKGTRVGYILGGSSDCNGLFSDDNRINHLKRDQIDFFPRRYYLDDNKNYDWFFNFVGNANYIQDMMDDGLLASVFIDIDDVQWDDGIYKIRLLKNKNNYDKYLRETHRALINYREKRIYFSAGLNYDAASGMVCMEDGFANLIKRVYDVNNNRLILGINPILFDEGKVYICYFRSHKRSKRVNEYNKTARNISIGVLNRDGDVYEKQTEYGTELLDCPNLSLISYFDMEKFLWVMIKDEYRLVNEFAKGKVTYFGIKKGILKLDFTYPNMPYRLSTLKLCLRSDVMERSYDFQVKEYSAARHVKVRASLDLSEVEWEQFYWDIKATVCDDSGKEYELLLRNYSKKMKLEMLLKNMQYVLPGGEYLVFSYLTNSSGFAVTYRLKTEQDSRKFVHKEYLALFIYYILAPYWNLRNIWLVYEKYSITAQDNSLYFFKYCMEKIPEKEKKHIYYVIDKKSQDYKYVEHYGKKVIQFLSLKHMIYLRASKMLISSDTKAHAYAWHSPNSLYRYMIKWKRNVFLQHGVIYYKQCHRGLRKNGTNNCRLFIVSSDVEKEIIRKYFGYASNQIAVTGLARWDVLHDTSVPGEKMILVMPTWRSWLEEATLEVFEQSDYYKNYMKLLNNEKLHAFLAEKDVKLIFYIHPKFREYMGAFSVQSPHIELIEFGTQPLNQIIMRCNMMITDYSSACWDVYYQGKPVLFYIFDFEMYEKTNGSYVDMRTEAFGEATDSLDELIDLIKKYEERGFKEEKKYADMRERLLPYRDDKNSERTYNRILEKFYNKKYMRYVKKGIIINENYNAENSI